LTKGDGEPAELAGLASNVNAFAGLSLFIVLIAVFAFFVMKNELMFILWRAIINRLGIEQHSFSVRLFQRYLRMPYMRHVDKSRMTLHQNLNIATGQIFVFSILPFINMLVEAIVVAAIVIFLLVVSPVATLALAVWIAVTFALFRLAIMRRAGKAGTLQRESFGRMLRITQDSLHDIKSIRLWGRERFFSDVFSEASAPFARAWADARMLQQVPRFTLEPILIGSLVAFAVTLALLGVPQNVVLLDLSTFAAAGLRLLPAANRTIGQLQTIAFYKPDLEAVWADAVQPVEELNERRDGATLPPFADTLKLAGMTVRYDEDAPAILRDVDLEIARGDKISIIGKSGCGKTTLLNAILGFLPISSGQILFDEQTDHPLARYRCSATAFVPQDICLLDDSILANVAFGAAADEDHVWECLHLAHFAEHVRSLPHGLLTLIGEDGAKISGGERQAARACPRSLPASAIPHPGRGHLATGRRRRTPDLGEALLLPPQPDRSHGDPSRRQPEGLYAPGVGRGGARHRDRRSWRVPGRDGRRPRRLSD
jgi:ABC-type bacteriocin/lantibiotic exporter with double-glycine peptidase domain